MIEQYFDRLFPICRSLTGNGNRETLSILSELVDLEIHEVSSGTECFDWTVPPEWNVREAWIKNSDGVKIVDFAVLNIHLLGYSEPFNGTLSLTELKQHLYSLPEQPDLVPYLTSYYKRRWGFCITDNLLNSLKEDNYHVYIDSDFNEKGSMTLGEAFIKGYSDKEIFYSTYICHPSLANNELSGPLVTAFLYNELKKRNDLKYSYRFVFVPETIGSISYLAMKGKHLKEKMLAGFVVTCTGDDGIFTYLRSRQHTSLADRASELVLKETETEFNVHDFSPCGSDERQYCSPGFNLPVGSLMRTMYGKYKEYHTSADNKDIMSFSAMQKAVEKHLQIIDVIENNHVYLNKFPFGEPQLGKRGLYPNLGSQKKSTEYIEAMLWLLNLSDGTNDLISIANKSGFSFSLLSQIASELSQHDVLEK